MDNLAVSIIILLVLIIANGIFAMTEIGVVTSRKIRLEQKVKEGNSKAKTALYLAENSSELLSTIQIGITLIGIISGAFGGAAIADDVSVYLSEIPFLAPWSTEISMVLVVTLTTFLTLVIGELTPKQIGLTNPEKVALAVAKPMYFFSKVAKPLIWILDQSTKLALKTLGIKTTNEPDVTEEEIQQMIEQGVHSGSIEEIEHEMVDQIFYMGDQRLSDILTPRTQLTWIDIESSFEENMEIISQSEFSRFPVGKGSLDHFLGIIHTKKVFSKLQSGEAFSIDDCIEKALILPEHVKVFKALETLKESGYHQAVVVDEYGGVEGFVTLNDIMQVIVGDIQTEGSRERATIMQRDNDSWLADGQVPFDTFLRYFDLEDEIDDDVMKDTSFQTLGGFITSEIGNTPIEGDSVFIVNLKLEVVDMDSVLVDKLLITRLEEIEVKEEDNV
ncbi:hemolysin family protein [Virgibacillus dokdonensis]|uniref:Magnesium and cobalt efflux protein CorC n=1 Tax=Virgibacillus dokdonensis TaxID=302167 RepID=A0A2K9IZ91_9BACI|nr:hemolysin family protein [Virgibacillus dokdonensis]AUJ25028.1 Magnesium and cobalt efflux protein CorC [Virgibacillus dokdonensis]